MHTIGRFAPSPSGRMHLGNVLCALLAWLSARQSERANFCCGLRIWTKCAVRAAIADLIIDDLRWLGLDWDGEIPYQSERTAVYENIRGDVCAKKVCCTRASARERPCTPQARRTCRTAGWSTPEPAAI